MEKLWLFGLFSGDKGDNIDMCYFDDQNYDQLWLFGLFSGDNQSMTKIMQSDMQV